MLRASIFPEKLVRIFALYECRQDSVATDVSSSGWGAGDISYGLTNSRIIGLQDLHPSNFDKNNFTASHARNHKEFIECLRIRYGR